MLRKLLGLLLLASFFSATACSGNPADDSYFYVHAEHQTSSAEQSLTIEQNAIFEHESDDDPSYRWPYWYGNLAYTWHFRAWEELRGDIFHFFQIVVNLDADWIGNLTSEPELDIEYVIDIMAFQVAMTKVVDPALYAEIMGDIGEVYDALRAYEDMSCLLDRFLAVVQQEYEERVEIWSDPDFYVHMHYPLVFYDLPWTDDWYGWDDRGGRLWEVISYIEFMFAEGTKEQGVRHVMFLSRFAMSGSAPDCPIWIMVAVDEETSYAIMHGLAERIAALQDGGFDIYKKYIEILTDHRRVFDPRTREAQENITRLIDELV